MSKTEYEQSESIQQSESITTKTVFEEKDKIKHHNFI